MSKEHCLHVANKKFICILSGGMGLQGGGILDLRSGLSPSSCPLGCSAEGQKKDGAALQELSLRSSAWTSLLEETLRESCHVLPT